MNSRAGRLGTTSVVSVVSAVTLAVALIGAQPGLGADGDDAAVGEAGAKQSTTISISSSVPAFHGRVKSGKKICRNRRHVQLFRKRAGKDPKLLGNDLSAGSGRWDIPVRKLRSGAYYAKVRPKARRGCSGARSKTAIID